MVLNGSIGLVNLGGGSGEPGKDGFSPIVETIDTDTGAIIKITDVEGTKTIELFDGDIGPIGPAGPEGPIGEPGIHLGEEPPTDPDKYIWINPNGQATVNLVTQEQMEEYVGEEIEKIELIPGPQGPAGADGAQGEPGEDGYTPVKGTDYWTVADKQEIINDVLAALPAAEEVSV